MRKGDKIHRSCALVVAAILVSLLPVSTASGQAPDKNTRIKVEGGVVKKPKTADSLQTDSLRRIAAEALYADSLKAKQAADSLAKHSRKKDAADTVSRKEIRLAEREKRMADTTITFNKRIFRDSIPISRLTLISFALPGFSQIYNKQAWKIPIYYGIIGGSTALWVKEQKQYGIYKREYDNLIKYSASRSDVDPVQTRMIESNTRRQIFMIGAIGTYILFAADGVINYPGKLTSVKKATTLSTVLPGAGQIYNKSYWKAPIVLGGFATMCYVVDWNNRGYKRFKLAYDIITDGDPSTKSEFWSPWTGGERFDADFIKNYKDSYRRNRDLCLILTGAFYLLNIIDAHVDAHMKDFDVSDDLTVMLTPTLIENSAQQTAGPVFGWSLRINF